MTLPQRLRYAVIMAGGTGTRFWPQSRRHLPKQFLAVTGRRTMLQETVSRLRGLVNLKQVWVVTGQDHARAVHRQLASLPHRNILIEPVGRGTAAAIGFAAVRIMRESPDALMVALPADHAISSVEAFRRNLISGFRLAWEQNCLVTIGITPRGPETGYGYIRLDRETRSGERWARGFIEKPSPGRARAFFRSGHYLWNSGIFIWRVSRILEEIQRYLPQVYQRLRRIAVANSATVLAQEYRHIPYVSIDHGVMEKACLPRLSSGQAPRVAVIKGTFGWNDIGSWSALAEVWGRDDRGNALRGRVIAVDAKGSLVYSPRRLTALLGVDDLIVVDADDALLVCRRDQAQKVRAVVEELQRRGLTRYL